MTERTGVHVKAAGIRVEQQTRFAALRNLFLKMANGVFKGMQEEGWLKKWKTWKQMGEVPICPTQSLIVCILSQKCAQTEILQTQT